MRFAAWEVLRTRLRPQRIVRDQRALLRDLLGQPCVLRRVHAVEPVGEHGDGAAAGLQRGAVDDAVDAARQPGDDGDAVGRQAACQLPGGLPAVGGGAPRADDGDAPAVFGQPLPADVDHRRRIVDLAQPLRVGVMEARDRAHARLRQPFELRRGLALTPRAHHGGGGAGVESPRDQLVAVRAPGVGEGGEGALEDREAGAAQAANAVQRHPVWQIICSFLVHGHSGYQGAGVSGRATGANAHVGRGRLAPGRATSPGRAPARLRPRPVRCAPRARA